MTYLRSVCDIAAIEPYITFTAPIPRSSGAQASAPSGIVCIPTRIIPNAPSFISTPACSMLTDVGAETCPSGDHVCSGHSPPSRPKPTISNGNIHFWNDSSNPTLCRSTRLNVFRSAWTNIAMIETQMSTLPPTRNSTSFMALYSFDRVKRGKLVLEPQKEISRYIGSTAIS